MPSPALRETLEAVAAGRLTVDQALRAADAAAMAELPPTDSLPGATVDLGRAARCRFGEVVFGEGKPASLIAAIAERQLAVGQSVLVTRVAGHVAAELQSRFAHQRYHEAAGTLRIADSPIVCRPRIAATSPPSPAPDQAGAAADLAGDFHAAVVTAGSTDYPVAAEAIETLDWMGIRVDEITDVGVAGPQRLLAAVPRLRSASVIVVAAGMEGALPSVVGGHVGCPVIAVPTGVGYGSALGGITAMLGMLTSCTANVSVVGIDAGFKAGYVAGLIATQLRDLAESLDESRRK